MVRPRCAVATDNCIDFEKVEVDRPSRQEKVLVEKVRFRGIQRQISNLCNYPSHLHGGRLGAAEGGAIYVDKGGDSHARRRVVHIIGPGAVGARPRRCFHLSSIPALASLGATPLQFDSNVTFLVGENGSGKSTLIEAMGVAYGLNPEGGTRNYTFSTRDFHRAYEGTMRRGRCVRDHALCGRRV